jgi:glycosyl transferase, family 25
MRKPLILIINLDRSVDRLSRIADCMAAMDLDWTRVSAVDGKLLDDEQRRQALDEPAFQRKHGMTPWPGELGCYLSHVEAMRQFLAGDAEAALILEDDAQPGPGLPAVLDALLACPERWDMVKLSAVHSGTPVPVLRLTELHTLAVMMSRCTGSSAYMVNRRAAEAYVDGLLPMSLPYDHVFDQGWRFGLTVRLVSPPPCPHNREAASTIGPGLANASRKFHWTRRWPTYAYRLGNELRRFAYALGSVMRERRLVRMAPPGHRIERP